MPLDYVNVDCQTLLLEILPFLSDTDTTYTTVIFLHYIVSAYMVVRDAASERRLFQPPRHFWQV